MSSYEIDKFLSVARQNGFITNQIKKLTRKICSNNFVVICSRKYSHINKHHYLKLRTPIMHRHFFRKLSQNPDYVKHIVTIEEIFFISQSVNG